MTPTRSRVELGVDLTPPCMSMAEWLESVGGGTLSLEHVKVADQKWILIIKQTAKI